MSDKTQKEKLDIDMEKYPQTAMFLQLEAARQITGHDYQGIQPSHSSLWCQVNDVHLNTVGIEQPTRAYREMVPSLPVYEQPFVYSPHKIGTCCQVTGVIQMCLTCKSKLGKNWMGWKPEEKSK